ncbi:hypothetical protein NPIL_72011 [Nephila pilipes]|uniref:Uncharacterized protein n=1 Tax=Nephila pilipes TaxID=299642 RepID=A0A8X6TJM1_NEPPI|nr:hypothetical protein NPIL_72011 [Nephila pilipes]
MHTSTDGNPLPGTYLHAVRRFCIKAGPVSCVPRAHIGSCPANELLRAEKREKMIARVRAELTLHRKMRMERRNIFCRSRRFFVSHDNVDETEQQELCN